MSAKIKIRPILFLFGLSAIVCLSGCAGPPRANKNVVWHQQYEPVEDNAALSDAHEILAEAERLFGKPILPVRNIHVRRSVPRKNMAVLSRADITSWDGLCDRIVSIKTNNSMNQGDRAFLNELRGLSGKSACEKSNLGYEDKNRIIDELNRFIFSSNFQSRRGRNFSGQSPNERRAALHRIFHGSVLPAPEKVYKNDGFDVSEILNESEGSFVIYVEPARDDPMFFFKLSHEVCHLINPYVYDWHVEGLCNYFAEYMGKKKGLQTELFVNRLSRRGDRDPYASSYLMTSAIKEIAKDDLYRLFEFAVPTGPGGKKMRIDIDSWLDVVSPKKRQKVKNIIRRWSAPLKRSDVTNSFAVPR